MAAFGEALTAVDLTPPRNAMVITPSPAAMARLQRLHAAAGDLAETAPEILANPEAARGLEQSLVELMVGCLSHQNARDNSLAQGQHAIIMRRFRRILEDNPEQPLYIPEICKAIRVPDRTLRQCCQEYLGMGPKHYFAAAPLASGAAGVAPGQVEYDKCHGNRHAVRILAARALRRRVPVPVRRAPIRHASPATRLAAGIRLPKLHSRPRGRTPKVEVLRSSPRR